jgi:hypothetical protein
MEQQGLADRGFREIKSRIVQMRQVGEKRLIGGGPFDDALDATASLDDWRLPSRGKD